MSGGISLFGKYKTVVRLLCMFGQARRSLEVLSNDARWNKYRFTLRVLLQLGRI